MILAPAAAAKNTKNAMESNKDLPIFLQDPKNLEIFGSVADAIPEGSNLSLYGGPLRNALYYYQFGQALPQRDYDCIFQGDRELLFKNLHENGFSFGRTNTERKVVLRKPKVENPQGFSDYVYLDIVMARAGETVPQMLKDRVNFTINGFALDVRDALTSDWREKIIEVPNAREDLTKKELHLLARHPINIYACLRFVSLGFKAPSDEEIKTMLEDLRGIDEMRFERDTEKAAQYVGGVERAQEIARQIGIGFNIFDLKEIKSSEIHPEAEMEEGGGPETRK